ncbi:MAG: hypothetical protein Tp1109DCM542121_23 [Prokaryotic dsDNA virus sp.]|nr:MAG: hypothetical protein Tp1109DCM542121_23 [Prokaryotic dsDNA virus sp.]|tara:strand:+ start:15639 stop:15938 length:300 start_codon:yes stop_codon:yes gene_type:complete
MAKKLTEKQKKIDMNNDGVIDDKDFAILNRDETGSDTMTPIEEPVKKAGGGMIQKYRYGGEVEGYMGGGEVVKGKKCPHRGTVRGTGAAIRGVKFIGVR